MLLITFTYKFLCWNMFSFILDTYLGGELLAPDNSMFNFLRNCPTVLHNVCTGLHSYEQCTRIPLFLLPHQYLLSSDILIPPILMSIKWYLILVLIVFPCGAFTYAVGHCIASLRNSLFKFLLYLKIVVSFWLSCKSSLYISDILDPFLYFFVIVAVFVVDLQCCVSFKCTAKWIIYTYTYIHSFLDSFSV